MQKEIESAYQAALKKKDDKAIALALSPFAPKTAEQVNSGAYEAAAGSCYAIFRCLVKTCKEHEDWFAGFTGYGDTYAKLAIFTEAVERIRGTGTSIHVFMCLKKCVNEGISFAG